MVFRFPLSFPGSSLGTREIPCQSLCHFPVTFFSNHSVNCVTPSPVLVDREKISIFGFIARTVLRNCTTSKSVYGSKSILFRTRASDCKHEMVLQRFVMALGHRQNHDLQVLAQLEFRRTHQVTHVLNDQ